MKKFFLLALVVAVPVVNASVCPQGQYLLAQAGSFTSSKSCVSDQLSIPGAGVICSGTTTTTQPYACSNASGAVQSSGVMTITNSNAYVDCNSPACPQTRSHKPGILFTEKEGLTKFTYPNPNEL